MGGNLWAGRKAKFFLYKKILHNARIFLYLGVPVALPKKKLTRPGHFMVIMYKKTGPANLIAGPALL
jgi:hypothetical protein